MQWKSATITENFPELLRCICPNYRSDKNEHSTQITISGNVHSKAGCPTRPPSCQKKPCTQAALFCTALIVTACAKSICACPCARTGYFQFTVHLLHRGSTISHQCQSCVLCLQELWLLPNHPSCYWSVHIIDVYHVSPSQYWYGISVCPSVTLWYFV